MKRACTFSIALPALIGLSACMSAYAPNEAGQTAAGAPSEEDMARPDTSPPREYTDEERKFLDSVDWCREEGLERFVGRQASDEIVAQAVEASGSKSVRVLPPGAVATMDYRTDRLNIETDGNGIIVRLRCG